VTAAEVRSIRDRLGLTQEQLAQLLGVHPLTVSKWERGVLIPSTHQATLLRSFRKAAKKPDVGETVGAALVTAGVALALFLLLEAAFGKKKR
jgi:transcriptional regulator with XRE-family HTH domain